MLFPALSDPDDRLALRFGEVELTYARLRDVGNIYGTDASKQIVDGVLARLVPGHGLFRAEEARLGWT